MFTIYQIINKHNGKSYVGFTTRNPQERLKEHLRSSYRGTKYALHYAIRKYGRDSFFVETLEEGWDSKIGKDIREPYWISVLKPEYNMTCGGEGTLGYTHSEETKRKISAKRLGSKMPPMSPEQRKAIGNRLRGIPLSENHKMKMGVSKIGNQFGVGNKSRSGMPAWNKGTKCQ